MNDPREPATSWWRFADEDLQDARIMLRQRGSPRNVCYLSQQASEKYLKGLLVADGEKPPKIHDLTHTPAAQSITSTRYL